MYEIKNLKTNETMRFETMQDVAEWFNFFEDIYEDGVWNRFIELHPSYEIKRVEDDNVDKIVHLTDEEYEELIAIKDKEFEEISKIFNAESFVKFLRETKIKDEIFF